MEGVGTVSVCSHFGQTTAVFARLEETLNRRLQCGQENLIGISQLKLILMWAAANRLTVEVSPIRVLDLTDLRRNPRPEIPM